MADPHSERFSGVNYYRFYVYGGFTFFIKLDQRKTPAALSATILNDRGVFLVPRRDLSKGERRMMDRILKR